jgi:hypothetical protein
MASSIIKEPNRQQYFHSILRCQILLCCSAYLCSPSGQDFRAKWSSGECLAALPRPFRNQTKLNVRQRQPDRTRKPRQPGHSYVAVIGTSILAQG